MAVTVPMLVAAFCAGVVARLWLEETPSDPAPGTVVTAEGGDQAPAQAPRASATRLVLTPASLHSDDEQDVASNRPLAPEPASRLSTPLAPPHESAARPEAVAPAGPGAVVPSPGSIALPSDPAADLKARPAQSSPPRRYVRKVIRKSAGYQTTEVPIFGPLFGWKF